MREEIRKLIEKLKMLRTNLREHDFLLSWEQSEADLKAVLLATEIFEHMWRANIDARSCSVPVNE